MDIRSLLIQPTDTERSAVDRVLGSPDSGWAGKEFSRLDGHVAYGGHAARARRHMLLPALHAVQDATGSISKGALGYISERLTVPPAEAYGVATFYSLFRTGGDGKAIVHVCDDIVCAVQKAEMVLEQAERGSYEVELSPCLGQCDRAPAVMYQIAGQGCAPDAPAWPRGLGEVRFGDLPGPVIHQKRSELRLLRRIGHVDPTSLDAYRKSGGYEGLKKAVELGPEGTITELEASRLRGRGGAAFPIGTKWRGVRDAVGEKKYVIANGDESEPGTFKDRVLMEGDPFAVVEAMTIYGFATEAEHGYIYVRGEYPTAERRLRGAIAQAYEAGLLGEDVAAAGFHFDLEVRRGAGAYICGEETALFASIEGYRGEPRQKPPFPTESGLFGKPTGINNIETLLAALQVLNEGARAFAAIGTEQSTGPKLFCVSGGVDRPGVFEVPFGTSLGELLDLAGAGEVGAVLMGGAAGIFIGEDLRDMPLSFEGVREAGATLGSGAVVVFDRSTDFGPLLQRIARFFRDESCGQCVPCRIGTVRQEEALHRISTGRTIGTVDDERARLDDLARVMSDASICGLGQTAASAIQSAIHLGLQGVPQ
ncbi:MAG TPA: NAD(P)H-dependent oxidoreductase subunit E [Acidimicrobiia bacterium]